MVYDVSPATLLVLAGAIAATVSCHREPVRPAPVSVGIIVVPQGPGSAQFEVHRDGSVRGGHLSGDAVPFVHQDDGLLDSAVVDSLWALATALDSVAATASPPAGRGYVALQLTFASGTAWLTSWPDTALAPDPGIRAVAAWLMAHRIGGW